MWYTVPVIISFLISLPVFINNELSTQMKILFFGAVLAIMCYVAYKTFGQTITLAFI